MKKQLSSEDAIRLLLATIIGLSLLSGLSSCRVSKDYSVTHMKITRDKFSNKELKRSMKYSTWKYVVPSTLNK